MHRASRRVLRLVSVSVLTLILLACGQTAGISPSAARDTTAPGAPQASTKVTPSQGVVLPHGWTVVSSTAALPYAYRPGVAELQVSAGCQPGDRMVGAGYAATSVFEYDASITSSYPTNDHTWVATGGTQAGLELTVYCLHGDHLPTVVIASATGGGVVCPADAVLLAEGFAQMAATATTRINYALCATSGVAAGASATTPVTIDSYRNGYMPVSASVSCPAGQLAFGGGSTGVGKFASGASTDFSGWRIIGGGEASGTVYADCVRLL